MCQGAACQPITLATVTTGVSNLHHIATDGTYVAFTVDDAASNGGGAYTVSVNGTNQTPTALGGSSNHHARNVTLVNGHVYWVQSDGSTLGSGWKATAGTASSASQLGNVSLGLWTAYGVAVDSTETHFAYLAYTASPDGGNPITAISYCDLSTTYCNSDDNYVPLWPGDGLVTDDTNVYWTQVGGTVDKTAITLGVIGTIATGQATPTLIAIDKAGGYLYWDQSGLGSNQIMKSPILSPSPESIGSSGSVGGLVADSTYAYWTDSSTDIKYVAVTGTGTVKSLVTGLTGAVAIAKDGKALYWLSESDGTIRKVALPL